MKRILTLASLLLIAGGSSAHQVDFNQLTALHKSTEVVVSFELNEKEIVNQYHFRAKYFDIERWMKSKNLELMMDHSANGDLVSHRVHSEPLQDFVNIQKRKIIHFTVDPFHQNENLAGHFGGEVNSVENRVNIAGIVAVSMCNAYSSASIKQASYHLVPKFIAPANLLQGLNPSTAELSDYSLSEGVKFSCVYSTEGDKSVGNTKTLPNGNAKGVKKTKRMPVVNEI